MGDGRVEGLKRELAAAIRSGDQRRVKTVKAELARLTREREKAVTPPTETTGG